MGILMVCNARLWNKTSSLLSCVVLLVVVDLEYPSTHLALLCAVRSHFFVVADGGLSNWREN
jgi:hypothetical protein